MDRLINGSKKKKNGSRLFVIKGMIQLLFSDSVGYVGLCSQYESQITRAISSIIISHYISNRSFLEVTFRGPQHENITIFSCILVFTNKYIDAITDAKYHKRVCNTSVSNLFHHSTLFSPAILTQDFV